MANVEMRNSYGLHGLGPGLRYLCWLVLFLSCTAPAWATTTAVHATDSLQLAIDTAVCGDTLVLEANARWTGNFTLPNKGCVSYITITSSGSLPPAGTRVGPAYSSQMGQIVTSNSSPAIEFLYAANYYQFVGVEIASSYAIRTYETYNIVLSGYDGANNPATRNADLPDHVIFDRVYIHGTSTGNVTRGIFANMGTLLIKNSYFSEIHTVGNGDTNCILSVNGRGPYLVDNNYLSCAGEDFLAGGGGDPSIPDQVLDGLTFTNNYVTKDLSWYVNAALVGGVYGGIHWGVKNVFEFKSVRNAVIDHNIFENAWTDAQNGAIILMQAGDQTGACTWCTVANVTFTNNIVRHGNIGMALAGHASCCGTVIEADNLTVRNNLFYDIHGAWGSNGGDATCAEIGSNYKNVKWDHNTCDNESDGVANPKAVLLHEGRSDGSYDQMLNLSMTNNLMRANLYGVLGSGAGEGTAALAAYANAGYTFLKNVLASDDRKPAYPATTVLPSIATFNAGFVDRAQRNYRLALSSPFRRAATDGTDIGVNVDALPGGAFGSASAPNAPNNLRITTP